MLCLTPERHIDIIDSFGELESQIEDYRVSFKNLQDISRKIKEINLSLDEKNKRIAYLSDIVDQIGDLELKEGEDIAVEEEFKLASNSEMISKSISLSCGTLTGDDDSESGFWVAKDNFKDIKPLLIGKQDYRSVIAFPLKDSILFSTDFPSAQNKLYIYNKIDKSVSKIADLCGPCTSGATCENGFILSSSVETQEPIKRNKLSNLKYLITRKKAKGVLDDYSRLYYFDYKTLTPKTLLKFKKDFWPAGAFRFGRAISLFHKQANRLYLFPMAVKKYDGKLFYINLKDIDL